MHEEIKTTLKNTLSRIVPLFQDCLEKDFEPHMIWRKIGQGQWHGVEELRPSLTRLFIVNHDKLQKLGRPFLEILCNHHPEYKGMMGTAAVGKSNLATDPYHLLGRLILEMWKRRERFDHEIDPIEELVQLFADFNDSTAVRFVVTAELVNFTSEISPVTLPNGLIIRQLTEAEITEIHGGPSSRARVRSVLRFPEFVLTGEFEEPKEFGTGTSGESTAFNEVIANLNRAILALRCFKDGPVGYDSVRLTSPQYCPLLLGERGFGNLVAPMGTYNLFQSEVSTFTQYARLIFANREAALTLACSRLADAQVRGTPQDRLIDAVIGLECLLLAGQGKERSELKHRFSLHYSTFFNSSEERYLAFREAKDIYDLRSTIAHGSAIGEKGLRVGAHRLTLHEAANKACDMLRGLITRFLPESSKAPYKNSMYWERKLFNLPDEFNLNA